MRLATLASMLRGDLFAAMAAIGPMRQAQRVAFLADAGEAGLLAQLAGAPATRDEIAAWLGVASDPDDALGGDDIHRFIAHAGAGEPT